MSTPLRIAIWVIRVAASSLLIALANATISSYNHALDRATGDVSAFQATQIATEGILATIPSIVQLFMYSVIWIVLELMYLTYRLTSDKKTVVSSPQSVQTQPNVTPPQ